MSNPTEPKFPKRYYDEELGRDIVAPDGWYLLPAGADLADGDRSWVLGGWGQPELWPHGFVVHDAYAWTYARKLPEGQNNDDAMPEQGAPEAQPQFTSTDPRTLARASLQAWGDVARAALERNTADAELQRKLFSVAQMNALIREFAPALIEHRPDLSPIAAASMAAEMARVALEKAAAFAAGPSAPPTDEQEDVAVTLDGTAEREALRRGFAAAPPTPEPTTAVDDEHLDPAAALKLYRSTVREAGHTHPDAPVLRMTHDGKVTTFGAIGAPAGCYLLPAGTELRPGDLSLIADGEWVPAEGIDSVLSFHQFTFARKLPPVERFDGSFP